MIIERFRRGWCIRPCGCR